jgi:hypothetical protein
MKKCTLTPHFQQFPMSLKKMKPVIVVLLLLTGAYMVYDAGSQPGVQDLPGNFEELALYRNENNTGPIVRIYAVSVQDTLWEEMQAYGEFMPHTKYGTTRVYFFRKDTPSAIQVYPGKENFDPQYQPYVLAQYEKDAMGQVSFRKLF